MFRKSLGCLLSQVGSKTKAWEGVQVLEEKPCPEACTLASFPQSYFPSVGVEVVEGVEEGSNDWA